MDDIDTGIPRRHCGQTLMYSNNDENQEDHGDDDDGVEDDGYLEAIVATAWCISAQSESFYRRRPSYLECNFQSYEKTW